MMVSLKNKSTNRILIGHLEIAKSFAARGKGLLGRKSLPQDQALWIHRCNSIHTCFMRFAIDCVFVDKSLKVKAVYTDVRPWRWVFPVWGANSVIEMSSGESMRLGINVGDQLDVGA